MCLINFNKGKDDEGFLKFYHNSEIECNCVREITEGLFRKQSTLSQHKFESLITVLKISNTLDGGLLDLEALGFSLSNL